MTIPKWINPSRQAELVKLFVKSQGFCIFGHYPCKGEWQTTSTTVCSWGKFCSKPVGEGEPCRYKPEQGMPQVPCQSSTAVVNRWHCAYGDYPCYKPFECHFEIYADRLIRDWATDDRSIGIAKWQAERKILHSLGETKEPLRGRFSNISRDIVMAKQPSYYLQGLAINGVTFSPFAKVRIANSYVYLYIDLGDSLKAVSKNKRRKATRYGKPLPASVANSVATICNKAVGHYLNR